ncbi:MAG: SirB2 family protein [Burkholderiales bacterium]|nr:SirB2 family protein [Burkholderiales bacterium]
MPLAELYPSVKAMHVGLVVTSGTLFLVRGIGVLFGSALPTSRPMRRLQQVVDTVLLLAALLLLAILGLNPVTTPWLATKLTLLVAYIVLGIVALHGPPSRAARALAFVGALACFALMYVIARTHDPLGPLRLLGFT